MRIVGRVSLLTALTIETAACFPGAAASTTTTTATTTWTASREPRAGIDDHPIPPPGWRLVPQTHVSAAMTEWAKKIVESPSMYPMGSIAQRLFGTVEVMARVEWHAADPGRDFIHRGVTLYQPRYDSPATSLSKNM